MCSAVLFFPSAITVLMNFVTSVLAYSGSAASSRFGISRLRGICLRSLSGSGMRDPGSARTSSLQVPDPRSRTPFHLLLGPLRAVFGAALFAALNADSVQRPADNVITNSRQILDAAAANEHE